MLYFYSKPLLYKSVDIFLYIISLRSGIVKVNLNTKIYVLLKKKMFIETCSLE